MGNQMRPSELHTASCGCRVATLAAAVYVLIATDACDPIDGFHRAVASGLYCPECAERAKEVGTLLPTEEKAQHYLETGLLADGRTLDEAWEQAPY